MRRLAWRSAEGVCEFSEFVVLLGTGGGRCTPATLSLDIPFALLCRRLLAQTHRTNLLDPCHDSHQDRTSRRIPRLHVGCSPCAIVGRRSEFAACQLGCRNSHGRELGDRLGVASCVAAGENDRARLAAADRQGLLAQWRRDLRQRWCTLHEVGRRRARGRG